MSDAPTAKVGAGQWARRCVYMPIALAFGLVAFALWKVAALCERAGNFLEAVVKKLQRIFGVKFR